MKVIVSFHSSTICVVMCLLLLAGPSNEKQQAVRDAFVHAWSAYKKHAWGHDELKPVSKTWNEWMGVGLTIVDSIDTIYIMGLHEGKPI